ncbi:leucine-rich repeat and guanylate kinase domain-containing protein-like isoform X2 [Limulus polyphemus]|uniref:Leucine-rich repeat and guanylate kinase domain-containing protein-like isoform X2 n=1 Tax=Limulus polyphemus TaxID=6850 RepID=A0ABM1T5G2_LIMPO|nr:leucine-rich repeat and guanylate kinase domain-containing protein-like isoform X2 [Limulus polyphemus]
MEIVLDHQNDFCKESLKRIPVNIDKHLSCFGKDETGNTLVFLRLSLKDEGLTSISGVEEYSHLQYVDFSNNRLTDLKPLGSLPFLLELNVSHNCLTNLLDFSPPWNLMKADFSYNNISQIEDLSEFHTLCVLILKNNKISEYRGLHNCKSLSDLDLSSNCLTKVSFLKCLPLVRLNLSHNKIRFIENLENLKFLQELNLNCNQISSLESINSCYALSSLQLEDNQLLDLLQLHHLGGLKLLFKLSLKSNKICERVGYFDWVLTTLPQLRWLDGTRLTVTDKVLTKNKVQPPVDLQASTDHLTNIILSYLQPAKLRASFLTDKPYPTLLVVGPRGSGKSYIVQKLLEEFPKDFGYLVAHTTRNKREKITERKYYFVSSAEFRDLMLKGSFLQTWQSPEGEKYGLTWNAIDNVASEKKCCLGSMELEGALSLSYSHLKPILILAFPESESIHRLQLNKLQGNETHSQWAISRRHTYQKYQQDYPKLFAVVVNTDNLQEAYQQVRQFVTSQGNIVKNY